MCIVDADPPIRTRTDRLVALAVESKLIGLATRPLLRPLRALTSAMRFGR
jgi:hypothetical protein